MCDEIGLDDRRSTARFRAKIQRRYESARPRPASSDEHSRLIESFAALGYSRVDLERMQADLLQQSFPVGCPTRWVSLSRGQTLVDMGAGSGLDSILLATNDGGAATILGIDVTPAAIARAKASSRDAGVDNVRFVVSDVQFSALRNDIADWVIANGLLSIVRVPERVIGEAFRVLRPGGTLCASMLTIRMPKGLAWLAKHSSGIHSDRREQSYRRLLEAAGFTDVRVVDRHAYSSHQVRDLWGVGPVTRILTRLADSSILRPVAVPVIRRYAAIEIMASKPHRASAGGPRERS